MEVAAPPQTGDYFSDGKRLVRVLSVRDDFIEAEDALTYMIELFPCDVFYREWKVVKPRG